MGKYIGRDNPYGIYEKQKLEPNGTRDFPLLYQVGTSNSILVVYGGFIQEPGVDYAVTNGGTTLTFLNFTPQEGFNLYLLYLGREISVPVAAGSFPVHVQEIGTGTQSVYTLPLSPLTEASLLIFKDNGDGSKLQRYGDAFTLNGNQVTFTPGNIPELNSKLDFYILGIERTDLVTVDEQSISTSKLQDYSVTAKKLNLYYEPYVPVLSTFGGMELNSTTIHEAEYRDEGKTIKLRLHFTTTLSGSPDNKIRFSLPIPNSGSTNVTGSVTLTNATSGEPGLVRWGGVNVLDIYRTFMVNFSLEEWTAEVNMEYKSA